MPKGNTRRKTDGYVPYARGFKVPTKSNQIKAIGYRNDSIPKEYEPSEEFFKPVAKCTSIDDWLAQYNEDGQTYEQFLTECPWLSSRRRKYMKQTFNKNGKTILEKYPEGKIYIVPVGDFVNEGFPDLCDLMDYTQKFLQIPVHRLPAIELEVDTQKEQVHIIHPDWEQHNIASNHRQKRKRKQLLLSRFRGEKYQIKASGKSALMFMTNHVPDDALCVIALTMCDLYDDDPDLFVAGLAAGNERVAIFSLHRYDPHLTFSTEFWFDIQRKTAVTETEKKERKNTILKRGCRLLVHEISHLLGIDHCVHFACCMNGSGHLGEDFSQPMTLCPIDLRKLQVLVGFDTVYRYNDLWSICVKLGFEEAEWFRRRIDMLESKSES